MSEYGGLQSELKNYEGNVVKWSSADVVGFLNVISIKVL